MKALSAIQTRCVIEATIDPLIPYRRGFARRKTGPFFEIRTVKALIARGHLRLIKNRAGRGYGSVTARAA